MRLEEVESLPDENLILPIKGGDGVVRDYEVKPVSAEWYYRFAALKQAAEDIGAKRAPSAEDDAAVDALSTFGSAGFQGKVLGADVAAAMLSDGVSSSDFRRAVSTALLWHATGGDDDVAARAWSGKASTAATIPEPVISVTSTSTGSARRTRSRASTKATTSPTV